MPVPASADRRNRGGGGLPASANDLHAWPAKEGADRALLDRTLIGRRREMRQSRRCAARPPKQPRPARQLDVAFPTDRDSSGVDQVTVGHTASSAVVESSRSCDGGASYASVGALGCTPS